MDIALASPFSEALCFMDSSNALLQVNQWIPKLDEPQAIQTPGPSR
jgi:hypothetical protein